MLWVTNPVTKRFFARWLAGLDRNGHNRRLCRFGRRGRRELRVYFVNITAFWRGKPMRLDWSSLGVSIRTSWHLSRTVRLHESSVFLWNAIEASVCWVHFVENKRKPCKQCWMQTMSKGAKHKSQQAHAFVWAMFVTTWMMPKSWDVKHHQSKHCPFGEMAGSNWCFKSNLFIFQ